MHHLQRAVGVGRVRTFDLVCRVCWFGLRQQITRTFKGRLQAQRIEVVLSAHKVGTGLSAGEKNGKKKRGLLCKGGGYADHQE